ncbi:hypothetical protein [Streptomyces aureocirculatus]|uniref:hypothetical protein n=1 Tax=Streptomyces aureocirculatus TaxID=67275 RepID=UPI0004C648F6|nr:hypothetical protein [Streptomyces aureocirculatus]
MSLRRRTSVLRTAAVTMLAGGALLLPVAAASADDAAGASAAASRPGATRTVVPVRGPGAGAVLPEGGVVAGADGVDTTTNPAFLVAGGAMAAAGAGGLGFALVRRGRTDA